MNQQKLFELNDHNRAAQLVFTTFATRRRSFAQTSVQDVLELGQRRAWSVDPGEIEALFKGLEAAGCGRWNPTAPEPHFLWLLKANEVARAAREEHEPQQSDARGSSQVLHTLRLRPDTTITLELPADFSLQEAERLCHFVRALPISEVEVAQTLE